MLKNKYEKYYDISLAGMQGFFLNLSTLKWLNAHGVDSVGKLFEITEDIDFSKLIQYSQESTYCDLYIEIKGSTDLLKYLYLAVDPMFDVNVSLSQLGFTRAARNQVAVFSKLLYGNTTMELLEKFTDDAVVSNLVQNVPVNTNALREIIIKSEIVCQYYHKKNENDPLNYEKELFQLYQQLDYFKREKEQLEEQISKIEKRIQTILYENEDHIDHVKMQKIIQK